MKKQSHISIEATTNVAGAHYTEDQSGGHKIFLKNLMIYIILKTQLVL